jgi:tRNA A-37 threonylcarbamoyl transferase component Bud32
MAPGALTDLLRQLVADPPLPAPVDALPAGLVIAGRYELVREIGRGGFGLVYEARDLKLPRSVAFKALQLTGRVEVREESLLREAEAAAQLSHPNIVTLHDVGRWEHGPYLVLELLQGRTLSARLSQGALPPPEALRIGAEVAKGLAHAHARGVVHRDLSPANVFLCLDGQVKVLDFGLAHGFGRRKLDGGTRLYMAPEQLRGAPEDERTDVFALAAVLYEMLSGEPPFPRAGVPRSGPTQAPHLDVPGAPGVGKLLERMLRWDPVERPRDAQEVAKALVALAQEAERTVPPLEPVRVERRRASARLAAAALAALVVSGIAAGWWRWQRTRAAPKAAPAEAAAVPKPVTPQDHGPARAPEVGQPRAPAPTPSPAAEPAALAAPTARPTARPVYVRPIYCRDALDAVATPPPESGDGVLVVEADPFGEFSVDGRAMGETPGECRVKAGTYLVRVAHPRFGSREARVTVAPGRRARWLANLVGER